MLAEPNPGVARSDTDSEATANGPRLASMLDSVGLGPRWKGLACAEAVPGTTAMAAAVRAASATARTTRRRAGRNDDVVIVTPIEWSPAVGVLKVHLECILFARSVNVRGAQSGRPRRTPSTAAGAAS